MKIVLVNYRYFISGGPERYLFNIKELLTKNGHEVIPFSIKHKFNEKTIYEPFFLDQIGEGFEVYSSQYKRNFRNIFKVIGRMIYSFEAKEKFKKFLEFVRPDLVYVIHFQNKISCSIIDSAKELNIPIIQRISDFGHICPNSHLYRNDIGICEDCIKKKWFNAIKKKCINDSYINSFFKTLSLTIMDENKIKEKINAFIFPSKFTLNKYLQAGFPEYKLVHIPTFFNSKFAIGFSIKYENFALYVGRIQKEKGIQTLVNAFIDTEYNLKIIGFSNDEYESELKTFLKDKSHNIEFLGKMDFDELAVYLSECLFSIVPSELYDNFPNAILESFAFKKSVIASNIGSLPELVNDETGLTFKYKDSNSLKDHVFHFFNHPDEAKRKGERAFEILNNKYSMENHYEKLIKLFENTISNNLMH